MKVVLGTQYGDEGKGRVVDLLSERADYVIRYQGGANSGHTVIFNNVKYVLHLIPSGIVHPNTTCLITNGVAFNPEAYVKEKRELEKSGVNLENRIFISERAGLLFPWHVLRDQYGSKKELNTTGQGIGPFYVDNASRRRRINLGDLINSDGTIANTYFAKRVKEVAEMQNQLLAHYNIKIDPDEIIPKYLELGKEISSQVADTSKMIKQGLEHHLDMLFEGAQAVLLDVGLGTGRYVTSSHTGGGALEADTGAPVTKYGLKRFGVLKTYMTRVGDGPFVTEDYELGERKRERGQEFGATTGRSRRMGWLDLVALKYAIETSGIDVLVLTKPDVLDGEKEVKVCTEYRLEDNSTWKILMNMPSRLRDLEKCKPIYKTFPGWDNTADVTAEEDLHPNLILFKEFIEKYTGVKIVMISTGPERKHFTMLGGFKFSIFR